MDIYDGNLHDTTNSNTDKFLKINSCGIQSKSPGQTVIRTKGRLDYHMILIESGTLKVKYKEKFYRLSSGNLFIYEPGEPHYYESLTDSTTLWMHFAGRSLDEVFSSMNILPGIYTKKLTPNAFEEYFKLIRCFHQPKSQNFVPGTFLNLLAVISDELTNNSMPEKYEIIWNILSYINMHPNEHFTLDFLANLAGYSKSRFSHLFSEVTGTTFIAYQRSIQMQNACELLTSSSCNIKDIAQSCGFNDSLYFCKIFKKQYGISPSEYRLKF